MIIHEWPIADEVERCEDCGKFVNPDCIETLSIGPVELALCGDCAYEWESLGQTPLRLF